MCVGNLWRALCGSKDVWLTCKTTILSPYRKAFQSDKTYSHLRPCHAINYFWTVFDPLTRAYSSKQSIQVCLQKINKLSCLSYCRHSSFAMHGVLTLWWATTCVGIRIPLVVRARTVGEYPSSVLGVGLLVARWISQVSSIVAKQLKL